MEENTEKRYGYNYSCVGSSGITGSQGTLSSWPNYSNKKFYDNNFINNKSKRKKKS